MFTSRAINYRKDQNIAEDELSMCVVIQKMVNTRTAGVAMTLNRQLLFAKMPILK
ncbi:PEP/pyruvate-binding domain-containing protein [Emticicia sp. W12TSBA100-4]|uniref:PEP/pyruvate-binding domain-containing protein n=1 Tax=Emticicia sp. W12TSBA100-4 TaxID=3160965 RepID=UPI0033057E91